VKERGEKPAFADPGDGEIDVAPDFCEQRLKVCWRSEVEKKKKRETRLMAALTVDGVVRKELLERESFWFVLFSGRIVEMVLLLLL
jgi:hypothetical protein